MKEQKQRLSIFPWTRKTQVAETEQLPYDMYIVVADDEDYFLKQTNTELTDFLKNFPQLNTGIATPQNVSQVIKEALRGNRGQQANIVILDQSLENHEDNWKLRTDNILSTCQKLGIQFPITKTGRAVPYDIIEKKIRGLSDHNGYFLGLVLRMAGFTGTICVLSNPGESWRTRNVHDHAELILEAIPDLSIKTPIIDRVLPKVGFTKEHTLNEFVNNPLLNPKR